ncbi:MAG: 50S ribosomal protein L10 [Rhodovibrionaceae bacterium]
MDRSQKEALVSDLNQKFDEATLMVVTQQSGLTVSEVTALRSKVRELGASYKVTKNRLTKRALQGTKFEGLSDLFTGPTAITLSEDPVAGAKACVEFAKGNEKLIIIGGSLNGEAMDAEGVKSLASLPSLDELRGKIVGLMQAPATKIAGVLQAPAGQMARVLGARGAQDEAA